MALLALKTSAREVYATAAFFARVNFAASAEKPLICAATPLFATRMLPFVPYFWLDRL